MKHLVNIVCFVALALNASAATWYVSKDGLDGNDGRSWETAQATIGLGIDNCKPGDTLYVAEGVYYESIELKDGLTIIGGWTEQGDMTRRPYGYTVLDGKNLGARLVTCEQDLVRPTLIANFVLQNARHNERGGAAWLRGKVTMRHCVVRGCSGLQCGGVLIKGDLP